MHKQRPSSQIAAEIREIRTRRGETQAVFAKACGTSQSRLSEWERAKDGYNFDPTTLETLARVGGVPESIFYEDPAPEIRSLSLEEVARLRGWLADVMKTTGQAIGVLDVALGRSSSVDPPMLSDAKAATAAAEELGRQNPPAPPAAAKPAARKGQRGRPTGTPRSGASPD